MGRKRIISDIIREQLNTKIDVEIINKLNNLAKDLGEPKYVLIEKALQTFILRQRKFLDARLKREKNKAQKQPPTSKIN